VKGKLRQLSRVEGLRFRWSTG